MGCTPVKIGDTVAIICGGRGRKKRCKCGAVADRECDWKVTRRGKPATCDKGVCSKCSVSPAPEKDLCQKHAAMWAVDPRNPKNAKPLDPNASSSSAPRDGGSPRTL